MLNGTTDRLSVGRRAILYTGGYQLPLETMLKLFSTKESVIYMENYVQMFKSSFSIMLHYLNLT